MSLSRGTIVGGAWTVQRAITGAPRVEAKATGHGAAARLTLIACPRPPSHEQLDRWETRLRPAGLDHAAYPALLGFGHDPALGALWIARAWSPFESIDSWRRSCPTLAVATLARSLRSLGD
ncbi:MAG: hypothetical protein KC464_30290, partial [Myxococcales bacterium]|nr:hypothetical protein [Myxococcales bacterium]